MFIKNKNIQKLVAVVKLEIRKKLSFPQFPHPLLLLLIYL